MTERTIRMLAKEYAGTFYEANARSNKFRRVYPTVRDYIAGIQYTSDGRKIQGVANWLNFVELARESLVNMLTMPDAKISPKMKEAISDALIEDREKQIKQQQAPSIRQINLDQETVNVK